MSRLTTNEDRNYKPDFKLPPPILTMGVEIQPEWSKQFHDFARMMNKSSKEMVNWMVDTYAREHWL